MNSGEVLDPENPHCTGTAPLCDLDISTTTEPPTPTPTPTMPTTSGYDPSNQCEEPLDVIPYPGDCHKYLMCIANANGGYDLEVIFSNLICTKKVLNVLFIFANFSHTIVVTGFLIPTLMLVLIQLYHQTTICAKANR